MSTTITHHIQGQSHAGQSQRQQTVTNPATGAVTAHVALASTHDVHVAVAAAQAAFPAWSELPPLRRSRVMFKFLELLNKHLFAYSQTNLWECATVGSQCLRYEQHHGNWNCSDI